MSKEQKKDNFQKKKTEHKPNQIVLSNKRSIRYKIIKIQKNTVKSKKRKVDTASTALQSQKQANQKPEDLQRATDIVSKNRRKNSSSLNTSNRNTTPEYSGDKKYKEFAKMTAIKKQFETQNNNTAKKQISSQGKNNTQKKDFASKATNNNVIQPVINNINVNRTENQRTKAAEINDRLKADVTKARNSTAAVENDMKSFSVQKAKETYKVKHLVKKGNVDSNRFRNAVNNTIKKEIDQNVNYNEYKGEAVLHYKKMLCITNQEQRISQDKKRAEDKALQNERLLKSVTTAVTLVKEPKQAAVNLTKDAIRKSKVGNAALTVAEDIRSYEDASKANSVGDGFSQVTSVLPDRHLKNAVRKTATDVITGRAKAEQLARKGGSLNRKYGYEAAKAQRAERNARAAKDSAIRKAKIQFYKEEKGLIKSASAMKNTKVAIKKAVEVAGKAVAEVSKKAAIALIAAIGPELLIILVIIIVIACLFTWMNPHEETIYVDETNTWETVKVETDKEILNGYIRHIRDYFDKKQLEILEVVDNNFGGFTPDKYNYDKTESKDGELTFDEPPKLNTEYVVYSVNKDVTYKYVTGGAMGATYWSEPIVKSSTGENIIRKEFFKNDPDLGYEVRTTSFDYEFERVYLLCAVNIEQYWMSKGLMKYYDTPYIFTCENGKFSASQDITNEMIVLRRDGEIIYEGSAVTYIMSHPELFEHTAVVKITEPLHEILDTKCSWNEEKKGEIIDDNQYVFENYIWNLYEYGNQWIKLSDDCDYESIIAMAAIKKWREIEADGFDPDAYAFEITDDDLDYCLNNLYDFSYGYKTGKCKYENCHKYYDDGATFYECDRPTTHKHLIGEVTNLELAGGIDYVLNKILVPPKASDYSTTEEYNKAKEQFKTDKEIYKVYVEFIHNELGTSTKLPDYENNEEAQYRLLRMYQAKNGKKPSNPPTDVKCKPRKEWITKTVYGPDDTDMANSVITFHEWQNTTQYAYLDVSWTAPAEEKVSSEKKVEISGYKIYAYNSSTGSKKLLKTTVGDSTSCTIEYMVGDYCSEITYYTEEYYKGGVKKTRQQIATKTFRLTTLPRFVNIIVEAYNDAGSGPQSSPPVYVKIEED